MSLKSLISDPLFRLFTVVTAIVLLLMIVRMVDVPDVDSELDIMESGPQNSTNTIPRSVRLDTGVMPIIEDKYEHYNSEIQYPTNKKKVLFFRANWCQSCLFHERNILAEIENFPEDLMILVVDYDKEFELRKKYGVMLQHSFVQIDSNNNKVVGWSGGRTLADILTHLQ